MKKKPRTPVDPEVIRQFAAEWADFRLSGRSGDFYPAFKAEITRTARRHGQTFGELWAAVHKAAYEIIDADPRSRLLSSSY